MNPKLLQWSCLTSRDWRKETKCPSSDSILDCLRDHSKYLKITSLLAPSVWLVPLSSPHGLFNVAGGRIWWKPQYMSSLIFNSSVHIWWVLELRSDTQAFPLAPAIKCYSLNTAQCHPFLPQYLSLFRSTSQNISQQVSRLLLIINTNKNDHKKRRLHVETVLSSAAELRYFFFFSLHSRERTASFQWPLQDFLLSQKLQVSSLSQY